MFEHLFSWYGILFLSVAFLLAVLLLYRILFKRVFDFMLSLSALAVLLLPLTAVAIAVKATSKGPVFFSQKRVGKNNRHFKMLKFRTMTTDAPKDAATHLLENAESYITPIGRFLRKYSLDELPQLLNILLGQMSIVGPRPALYNQYDLIKLRTLYNCSKAKPGLTGLAQISGRDELEIEKKAKIDGEYCERITLVKDVAIIFRTAFKVLRHEGLREGKKSQDAGKYEKSGKVPE